MLFAQRVPAPVVVSYFLGFHRFNHSRHHRGSDAAISALWVSRFPIMNSGVNFRLACSLAGMIPLCGVSTKRGHVHFKGFVADGHAIKTKARVKAAIRGAIERSNQ
jgi:hypothetical protein